jgi:hypothetical protein
MAGTLGSSPRAGLRFAQPGHDSFVIGCRRLLVSQG